jgi:hypothetical protein
MEKERGNKFLVGNYVTVNRRWLEANFCKEYVEKYIGKIGKIVSMFPDGYFSPIDNEYFEPTFKYKVSFDNDSKFLSLPEWALVPATINVQGYCKNIVSKRPGETLYLIPKKIIYNPPATIVFWEDGTKTVVKCSRHDLYSPYGGFCAALAKKVYGSGRRIQKYVDSGEKQSTKPLNQRSKPKCRKK